ncbi:hypothetical protein KM043_005781 [Ampulex compressa]|nr:hypothetical protein KM043_005781 [Ampulex compressa]
MRLSLSTSLIASWAILCLSNPLQVDNQRYWIPYKAYQLSAHEFQPIKSAGSSFYTAYLRKPPPYHTYYDYETSSYENPSLLSRYEYPGDKLSVEASSPDFYIPLKPTKSIHDRESMRKEVQGAFGDEEVRFDWLKNEEDLDRKVAKDLENASDFEGILSTDYSDDDIELKNRIEKEILSEGRISEETRRVVRQVSKRRPGFFWTLARLAFETYNDTRSAIQQINEIVNNNIAIDTTTSRATTSGSFRGGGSASSSSSADQTNVSSNLAGSNTTSGGEEKEERPYQLTRNGVLDIISRNLKGLRRLFNIEWREALDQSEVSVREFQKNLGNQIGFYLRENPNA